MMTRMAWLALVLVFAACSSGAGFQRSDVVYIGLPYPCVPPDLPPVSEWEAVAMRPQILFDLDGRPILGFRGAYRVGDHTMSGMWVNGSLAVVDPNPDDPKAPAWYDAGLMDPSGKIKPGGAGICDWRRDDATT